MRAGSAGADQALRLVPANAFDRAGIERITAQDPVKLSRGDVNTATLSGYTMGSEQEQSCCRDVRIYTIGQAVGFVEVLVVSGTYLSPSCGDLHVL